MNVTGPHKNKKKEKLGQPKRWYLSYFSPRTLSDGSFVRDDAGNLVLQRHRPYFATKAEANAEKKRLQEQATVAGTSDTVLDPESALDYAKAKKIVGDKITLVDVAEFWRRHHPADLAKQRIEALADLFLEKMALNLGKGRDWSDLCSRLTTWINSANVSSRYPETIKRAEVLEYLWALKKGDGTPAAPRTKMNHKTAIVRFFNWLVAQQMLEKSPIGIIKKSDLPRVVRKEVEFLTLVEAERYLRAAERYCPQMVAHEIIQLISGVRSDEEMGNFDGKWVFPSTQQITIPAEIAKTGKREVIKEVEPVFWSWWKIYGRKGLLRPKNFNPNWYRIRVLALIDDQAEADELAKLPIKTLLRLPVASGLSEWKWNARRRSFCTYHVAKHDSAEITARLLRHRGSISTLYDSYQGHGVTQEDGVKYFNIQPQPVANPILPEITPKGIVKLQMFARATQE